MLKQQLLLAIQIWIDKHEFYSTAKPPLLALDVLAVAKLHEEHARGEHEDGWNPTLSAAFKEAGFQEMIRCGEARYNHHILLSSIWDGFKEEEIFKV